MPNWECLFVHRKQGLFPSVHVDDIKKAGRKQILNPMCKKLKKLYWKLDGKKYRIGNVFLFIENKDHSYRYTTSKWLERREEHRHHFLTTCTSDALSVNANRMKLLLKNIQRWLNHVFLLELLKSYQGGKKPHAKIGAWSCDMERHARQCLERYCELTYKTMEQLYKDSRRKNLDQSENYQQYAHKWS